MHPQTQAKLPIKIIVSINHNIVINIITTITIKITIIIIITIISEYDGKTLAKNTTSSRTRLKVLVMCQQPMTQCWLSFFLIQNICQNETI